MNIFRIIPVLYLVFHTILYPTAAIYAKNIKPDKDQLSDRILLAIGPKIFTQRQIESYIFVHHVIGEELNSQDFNDFDIEKKWSLYIKTFEKNRIIGLEAEKLGRFYPNRYQMNKLYASYTNRIKQSSALQKTQDDLALSTKAIFKYISLIKQIDQFKYNKTKLQSDWNKQLKTKYVVRYFDDALTYKKIFFPKNSH